MPDVLYVGLLFLAVVVGDDLPLPLVAIHPHRVAGEHLRQPLLDHISDVCSAVC
jgi:hypothetical protein